MPIVHIDNLPLNTQGNFLVRYLIPAADLTVVWGAPKCGKTFWAIDLAMHIAAGIDYRGRKVKGGPVVYCSLEGNHEFAARVHAAKKCLKVTKAEFYCSKDRRIFTKVGGSDGLIKEITADVLGKPVLVVIDTLNKSLDGSENSDEDMTHYTRCAEAIFREFECAVIIIHHCGVSASKPRGHTSLTGTCAAQIKIARASVTSKPMLISSMVEFMKDGPEGGEDFSYLRTIEIGKDEDGLPIETCYIEYAPAQDKGMNDSIRTPQAKHALTILETLIKESDESEDRAPVHQWRAECDLQRLSKTKTGARRAFDRAVDALCADGTVTVINRWVYIGNGPKEGEPA